MKFIDRLFIYLPFSYMWVLRRSLGNPETILDLGCGDGSLIEFLANGKKWKVVGVDLFAKNVKFAKKRRLFVSVANMDVLKFVKQQALKKKKYDVVFCSQLIEHMERDKGEKLLAIIDRVAKQRIIMGTPREFMEQPHEYLGNNPYQIHKSGWSIDDFKIRDYKVFGIGLHSLWSEEGLIRTHNKIVVPFFLAVSFLLSPVVYFIPSFAAGILCIKDVKK